MHKIIFYIFFGIILSGSCWGQSTYNNPIINLSMPDPTIVKAKDGYFYIYATENTKNVPIYKSKNLVDWEFVSTAFTDETRPNFEPKGSIWAPDVSFINGKYVMHYSMSIWGGEFTCGIGTAVSNKPEGPFVDQGKLFRSNEIDVRNSIDPFYIKDKGKQYLFWGSFHGIYYSELTKDALALKDMKQVTKIAGNAFEGVYIHKRGKYYYMFASIGRCCEGVNSTYELVVGRSKNLLGTYVDKDGKDMLENGYSKVISNNERFVGNGHCSEIVKDDRGNDWILYHGVDVEDANGRKLLLDEVKWDKDAWPYVETGTPSLSTKRPSFK